MPVIVLTGKGEYAIDQQAMRAGAADYLEKVMYHITYVGAAFLCIIAVVPIFVSTSIGIPYQISAFLGGTGLLIVVSVALDIVQRIEANLLMQNYAGFLSEGGSKGKRIKGRNY